MKFWHELCETLGREDLKLKQMVQDEEKECVFKELQKEFSKKTREEWFEIFKDKDACVMPVKSFSEACKDPQIISRNMVFKMIHPKIGEIKVLNSPIKMSRTPPKIKSLAPKVGEHTKEILESLNYTKEQIKDFKKNGVI
jgi:crotonobetainyl-CoA:carnitine CoA-transferase CaiB-like acyl-CoA transferase